MNLFSLMTLLVLLTVSCSEAYKIMILFNIPIPSLSHLGAGFVRHLLDAGHEVTYVTPYPEKWKTVNNLRVIDVGKSVLSLIGDDQLIDIISLLDKDKATADKLDIRGLMESALETSNATFQDSNFLKVLQDPTEEFDAVIVELYEIDVYAGLSVLYNCPIIWSYSMTTQWSALQIIDEASNPAYTVDYLSKNVPPLTFVQRLEELWSQVKGKYLKEFVIRPQEEVLYKNIFEPLLAMRGRTLPSFDKVAYNASLVFVNEFNALGNIPSTPQNLKFAGGQHIELPIKPLNQTIMDTAEHGVIYFSFGSVFDCKVLPMSMKRALIKMFGELKQTVIWKCDDQALEDIPKNLIVLKWAPQASILNHPKCLIFITHGGILSTIETVHFNVPTIAVPIFFDQSVNAKRAAANGYSITIQWSYDLAQDLKQAILEMLTDKRYTLRVKQLSQMYHDRLAPLGKELVYWVEHVVRSGGAVHLQSPALQLSWYQKMYLDFITLIVVVLLALRHMLVLACRKKTTAKKQGKVKRN